MPKQITIKEANGKWLVLAAGAVLGESTNALILAEGDYPPVVYIPRDDIAMAFFEQTEKSSHCPWKGQASYYTINGKSGPLENVAWSYQDPLPEVAKIKDHLAFYTDRVSVQQG